jgi:hypothetical protein
MHEMQDVASPPPPYRLDELGWLQFERLCGLVLEREVGLTDLRWIGHADEGRVALVDQAVVLPDARLHGPLAVAVVWVRADPSLAHRLMHLFAGASAVRSELGFWFDRVLVLTNLDSHDAQLGLAQQFTEVERFAVLGARELGECLDRRPDLRAAMPSVLGLRDLGSLISPGQQDRSSLDVGLAQELARVFWPTRAYERARAVLDRHRFVVLTGPPEMGKTAIARMLALAQLTDGWEAYECNSPEQVWAAFDPGRRQVFVADDAFGSTEYRADAAELWARELGRMLRSLDDRHWLVWTSRPAPLKAGLRRVQRERGSEHFPAPGEVLVDASELDLAEKTLILFRHAKNRNAGQEARRLLRSAGASIVEHPHFTPERIRRFVTERLDELPKVGDGSQGRWVLRVVERELARPTEAMRNSFHALGDEHRELLISLLDAPAGLIDERELAATVRRHHEGGLSRPPGELIDRLADHFLRITPLGIGWVHPSWRDLVIGELRGSASARQRFLTACGIYGVLLALSQEGGAAGERSLPLLMSDSDWDTLGDRVSELLRELEHQDLARLLLALDDALNAELEPAQHAEVESLAQYVLGAIRRSWEKQGRPLPVFALEAWFTVRRSMREAVASPAIGRTWTELHPTPSLLTGDITAQELQALDEWLALAQVLARNERATLNRLGFYDRDEKLVAHAAIELAEIRDPELWRLAESVLGRIRELSPSYGGIADRALRRLEHTPREQRWWVPEDIAAPPTTEPVAHEKARFTREDVARVLSDL